MIQIPFSNGNFHWLKNQWEELTATEYKSVLKSIMQFVNSEITLLQLRLNVFFLLSGLKPRLTRKADKADQQAENIYRIAKKMNFMIRIEYENNKSFSKLPKGIRGMLERYIPSELDPTPEVRWATKENRTIHPDLVFAANLIPTIGRRRHTMKGYTFELNDKILTTSLTTSQFIDAQTVATEIQETGKESLLNLLVAILYRQSMPCLYDPQQSAQLAKTLGWLDMETKKAIFINFNAIQSFLYTRTKYSILFNASASAGSATDKGKKHNIGLESVAYSLIKAGYGDIENGNLVKFFEIMYSDLISNVTSLQKQGHPIDKIAEVTGLTISKINQIL